MSEPAEARITRGLGTFSSRRSSAWMTRSFESLWRSSRAPSIGVSPSYRSLAFFLAGLELSAELRYAIASISCHEMYHISAAS